MSNKDNYNENKNKGGRPTKYTTDFIDNLYNKLIEFIKVRASNQVPFFLLEFNVENDITRNDIWKINKKSKQFKDAIKKAKELQELLLAQNMIKRGSNTGAFAFALKNVAGWKDRQEVNNKGIKSQNIIIMDSSGYVKSLENRFKIPAGAETERIP